MFKTWKGIEKRFRKMKVKEEEKKRKKANKDAVDDQRREMTETNGRKMTVKTQGRKVMEIKGRGRMMII